MRIPFQGILLSLVLAGSTVYGQTLTKKGLGDGIDEPSKHGGRTGLGAADSSRGQLNQRGGTPVQRGGGDSRVSMSQGDFHDQHADWRGGAGRHDGDNGWRRNGDGNWHRDGDRDGRRDRDFRHDRVQTTFVFVNTTPFYYSDYYANAPTVAQVTDSYYQPGYQWGVALSQYSVTWDQLIAYLQTYILNASPTAQDAFRSGFIDGFGGSGPATFDHAVQVASSQ